MYSPLLDLVECLQLGDGDKHNDGLLSALDINLPCGGDLKSPQLDLELGNVVLEVEESLSDGKLSLGGGGEGSVGGAEDLVEGRHAGLNGRKVEESWENAME